MSPAGDGLAAARGGLPVIEDPARIQPADRPRVRRGKRIRVGGVRLGRGDAGEDPPVEDDHRPTPPLSGAAATAAASTRFRGPSHPASLEVRIAPVIATGTAGSRVRPSRYAVSSRMSVPWVTTMPRTSPDSARLRTRSRSAQRRSGSRWQAGSRAQSSIRYGPTRDSSGAKPTSASPPWAGTLPPAAESRCMEMVPPVKRRWIIRRARCRRSR